ncbi:MAG: T9SS type A sorting domain-containing protein [Cytophagales bacterium]|nr:T9SS type A sorting domain-containing protein [Cytophagales bacterium]
MILLSVSPNSISAQSQAPKFIRTYQSGVFLNSGVPYVEAHTEESLKLFVNMQEAFSLDENEIQNTGNYGVLSPLPPGSLMTVEIYDQNIFENKSNDFINRDGLLYGIKIFGAPYWERNSYTVKNCLYGNRYNLHQTPTKTPDDFGTVKCPGFSRASDDWRSNYLASAMEYLKRENPNDDFRYPFTLNGLPAVLRVTIEEEEPMTVTNSVIRDSHIPGIPKLKEIFNFDEPQKRQPIITMANEGYDGTVHETNFITENSPTLFTEQGNGWTKPSSKTDLGFENFNSGSGSCIEEEWPIERVYKWTARYEEGTIYENPVNFFVREKDVKFYRPDGTAKRPEKPLLFYDPNHSNEKAWDVIVFEYAKALGRIPRILRGGVTNIYMKTEPRASACGHDSKSMLLSSDFRSEKMEETVLHEAVHITLDEYLVDFDLPHLPHQHGDPNWAKSIAADGRNYSQYVQENDWTFKREQVSEHFAVFLWLRNDYFKKKARNGGQTNWIQLAKRLSNQAIDFMPNRINYFQDYLLTRPYNGISYQNWSEAIYPLQDKRIIDLPFDPVSTVAARPDLSESGVTERDIPAQLEAWSIVVYPNPSEGKFSVNLTVTNQDVIPYRITDLAGRTVYSGTFIDLREGSNSLEVDMGDLVEKGVYILQLHGTNLHQTKRLLIR